MQKTLGGERLGSGKKMKVNLHGYERSTNAMGYLWRSTMAPGTLVPFICEVALPGDTFDIDLDSVIMTHPTIGPLFGSYKAQYDVFQAPMRLYNSLLHNNALKIGLNMEKVAFPTMTFSIPPYTTLPSDIDNSQINPSCILNYLGIKGFGINNTATAKERDFNGIPILAYWEIYKNYYANKQEELGAVLHTPTLTLVETVDDIKVFTAGVETTIPALAILGSQIRIYYTGTTPIPEQIIITTLEHGDISALELGSTPTWINAGTYIWSPFKQTLWGDTQIMTWRYTDITDANTGKPSVVTFDLSSIDEMRKAILAFNIESVHFDIFTTPPAEGQLPYKWLSEANVDGIMNVLSSQEGLGLKTYQSDLFNNWLNEETIDGTNGINAITAVDVTGGLLYLDTLNLQKRVYNFLTRVAVSGGTYQDWLDVTYDHQRYTSAESPMYMGGLIKELAFQEVVSNSQSADQPLGTLAGRGQLTKKHKGGHVVIKVDEPSYIIGIVSLTPRIDYSQGNKWDTLLMTMNDLHKPALDEIGFEDDITERRAWWDTTNEDGLGWVQKSAGKQPAWMNYRTNVNQTKGNFAIANNEMFMTLNRRYEIDPVDGGILDLTTYIDPSKFNHIFAETSLDAQNFWVQIAVDMTVRRKMTARLMPNI